DCPFAPTAAKPTVSAMATGRSHLLIGAELGSRSARCCNDIGHGEVPPWMTVCRPEGKGILRPRKVRTLTRKRGPRCAPFRPQCRKSLRLPGPAHPRSPWWGRTDLRAGRLIE